jgi:cell cycle sensor histidine kinase DivJ
LDSKGVLGLAPYLSSLLRVSAAGREADGNRRLVDDNPDLITRHDEKGCVVFASRASRELIGESEQAIIGDGLFQRVHVADRPAYLTALSRALASNAPVAVEFRIRRSEPGGVAQYVWVEMRCRPESDRVSGVVAVTRDISGRKAHEAELLRARDDAESASRAKTQFLAKLSHELRTPLNAVIGFSEILDREMFGTLGEARYRDYARLIRQTGEHILHVVNEVLDLSKIEAGKFKIVKEPLDVGALVALCCDMMRHAAEERSLSLVIDVALGMPALAADKQACRQMLLNVIANAVKFTDPGGVVRVAARVKDGNVELSVADNGIGIAEQDLARLGNPFVQADNACNRAHDGTGLGLSVVNGLARLHGGRLELASILGEGTTATIVLPYDTPCESRDATPERQAVSAA